MLFQSRLCTSSCTGGGSSGCPPANSGERVLPPFVVCQCGKEAVIRTSRQPHSYGDTFYGCNLGKQGCNFFAWTHTHVRTVAAAANATQEEFRARERERDGMAHTSSQNSSYRPMTPSMRALLGASSSRAAEERFRGADERLNAPQYRINRPTPHTPPPPAPKLPPARSLSSLLSRSVGAPKVSEAYRTNQNASITFKKANPRSTFIDDEAGEGSQNEDPSQEAGCLQDEFIDDATATNTQQEVLDD
jgi:GRF zinc finger